MTRFLVAFSILSFFTSAYAQSIQQDGLKKELQEGLYSGCITKQSQSELTAKKNFTEDVCSCYAKNTTEQIFKNLDFQIGLKRKDDGAMKSAIAQIVTKEKSAITFQQCLNTSQEIFKENKQSFLEKPSKELSTKRGLLGEGRDSFIKGGIIECNEAAKSSSTNTQAYCSCSVNTMADNISQKDLYELGINSVNGQRKMKEMGELAMRRCSHFLK
jgi:hypothetical protein